MTVARETVATIEMPTTRPKIGLPRQSTAVTATRMPKSTPHEEAYPHFADKVAPEVSPPNLPR